MIPGALFVLMTASVGVQAYSGAVHGTLHAAQDFAQSRQAVPVVTSPDCPLCVASHAPAQLPHPPVGVNRLDDRIGQVVPWVIALAIAAAERSQVPRAPPVFLLFA